jgi:hypothetical protein
MLPFITVIGTLLVIGWLNLLLLWMAIWAGYLISILLVLLGREAIDTICLVLKATLVKVITLLRGFCFFLLWIDRHIIAFEDLDRVIFSVWIAFVLAGVAGLVIKNALGDLDVLLPRAI